MLLPPAEADTVAAVKSPKSVASPVFAIVTKSIVFTSPGEPDPVPPTNKPLVSLLCEVSLCQATDKSPKSAALPVVIKVKCSITFTCGELPSLPPP